MYNFSFRWGNPKLLLNPLVYLCITIILNSLIVSKKSFGQAPSTSLVGRVTDVDGREIPGVEIYTRESARSSISQKSGLYNLNIGKSDSTIIFSKVGYIQLELAIGDRKVINVKLQREKTVFNETINLGYGSGSYQEVAGSLVQIKPEDFIKAPVSDFIEALSGRIAGVKISSLTGQPGEAMDVVVRGANSLYKNYSPLYVIDGVIVDNIGNVTVNPEEISSLTVLKDASLTSIYGARGANGVLIINTKKGLPGKSTISFNTTVGFQQFTNKIKMMDSYDFVKYQTEINQQKANELYNRASLNLSDPLYNASGRTLSSYKNIEGIDWQDEIFRSSPIQIHNIGIRGGDKDTRYSLSGSIFDQNGVIINSGANRYQGRATLDQIISKKIRIGLTANYGRYSKNGYAVNGEDVSNSTNYALFRAWGARPVSGESNINLLDYAIDPDYKTSPLVKYNPIISIENESKTYTTSNLLTSAYFELDILKNLKFRSIGSLNADRNRLDIFYNSNTPGGNSALAANGAFRYMKSKYFTNENTLNYANVFKGAHSLEVLAGFSYYNGMRELFGFSVSNLPNEDIGIYGLDEGLPYATESNMSKYSFRSYFGRVNYDYKSKYYLSASLRAEELPFTNNIFSYSPSFSVGWNMMAENILKGSKIVSTSKLRFGYGQIQSWAYEPFDYISTFGKPDAAFNGLLNLDGRRETIEQYNIGYDFGLFKDKIALSLDVYRKENVGTPYLASIRNEGLEVSLSTNNIQADNFKWTSHFNVAFNKNKILSINNTDAIYSQVGSDLTSPLYVSKPGYSAGMFYGYVFDGIYQVEDFDMTGGVYILKSDRPDNGSPRSSIQPGDIRYKDLDGNLSINQDDQTIIGRSAPKHFGGLLNNFNYKAFDLSVLFQWSYGNQIYNANRMLFEGNYSNLMGLNQYASYNDRWTAEKPSNELFRTGGQGPTGFQSSRVLEDGSYLRLKTISIGYAVPKRHIKSLYLSQLNVRFSAQNLFTITKYSGLDPEVSARHSVLTPGFDYAAYPQAKTISLGLHATF